MSVGYSLRIRDLNASADTSNIGVRLGRSCIAHGVPVAAVAEQFGVTRATIYNWFTGASAPQTSLVPAIEKYLAQFG